MANLRVNKITSTETFEKTGSVQFDGSGDFLSLAVSSDFQFGSGDFTIECWALAFDEGTDDILGIYNTGSNRRTFALRKDQTESMQFLFSSDGSSGASIDSADGIISLNTWHHYAVVRKDLEYTIYLDGKNVGSKRSSDAIFTNNDDGLRIGSSHNTDFAGHISNVRIIKGKALYTTNFKPSMKELEVTPETVLLACQSKTDPTLEKTGKTLTVNGQAVANEITPGILTPVPKAGAGSAITGSVEFTSTNDALVLSAGEDFAYGTGDFTIEAWIQPQGTPSGETKAIFTQTQSGNDYIVFKVDSDKAIKATFGSTTVSGGTVEVGSWHHVAVTRASNTVKIFVNGVASSGTTVSTDFSDTTRNPTIGQYTHTYGNIEYYGFISNLRIVKGTALYTHDFIPPTRELKKVPGTVLLCCQDPNDPTTEATGKTITGYGNLDTDTSSENLITNGNFTTSASDGWTIVEGSGTTVLGGAQSGTFGNGEHLVLTATSGSFVFLGQQFTTKIGSTYLVNVQSNGADESFISTDSDKDNAIITDIRNTGGNNKVGNQMFVATQTSYHMILRGGTGGGNFDTASVYKVLTPNGASDFTPQVGDDRNVILDGVTNMSTENYFYLPTGDTESRTLNVATQASSSARGIFMGGLTPAAAASTDIIDFVTVTSTGNAQDFGDLDAARRLGGACSSSTRGVAMGGFQPAAIDTIQYVTMASKGDAQDFGNLSESKHSVGGSANSIRGLAFGSSGRTNTIEYITIASTGDAQDFGDMVDGLGQVTGTSSPTRCVMASGESPSRVNVMQYVTIMSMGNAFDFGDLTVARSGVCSFSSATRGLYLGGELPASPNFTNTVDFVTIASTGNAIDFGDLDDSNGLRLGGIAATPTRGLYAGGGNDTPASNTAYAKIHHFTIATTGNATDFGDLTQARFQIYNGTVSSGHGGLG